MMTREIENGPDKQRSSTYINRAIEEDVCQIGATSMEVRYMYHSLLLQLRKVYFMIE
jgi:hypothetical protein